MTHRLVFDMKRLRPGCALLQAVMGGDHGIASRFPTSSWLVAPTDEMSVYRLTDEQLNHVVTLLERLWKGKF